MEGQHSLTACKTSQRLRGFGDMKDDKSVARSASGARREQRARRVISFFAVYPEDGPVICGTAGIGVTFSHSNSASMSFLLICVPYTDSSRHLAQWIHEGCQYLNQFHRHFRPSSFCRLCPFSWAPPPRRCLHFSPLTWLGLSWTLHRAHFHKFRSRNQTGRPSSEQL